MPWTRPADPATAPQHFDAQTGAAVVPVWGPEPVGAAIAVSLSHIYGANAWGNTGAPPGWGGDMSDAADLGPAAVLLQNFAEPNLPTAPGALSATGSDTAVPGVSRVQAAMGQAGI